MNEDWKDRLQSKLDGFTAEPDESLWVKISEDKRIVPFDYRHLAAQWLWLPAAAASLLLFIKPDGPALDEPVHAVIYQNDFAVLQTDHPNVPSQNAPRGRIKTNRSDVSPQGQQAVLDSPVLTAEASTDNGRLMATETQADEEITSTWIIPEYLEEERSKPVAKKPVLSLFAQLSPFGNTGSVPNIAPQNTTPQNPSTNPGGGTGPSFPGGLEGDPGTDDPDNDSYCGQMTRSSSSHGTTSAGDGEVNYRHFFPVQVGARVRLDLTDRFGLETGMTYLFLQSSADDRMQKLHYLGIPVHAYYNAYRTGPVAFYASAGAQAYKCIAGDGPDKPWLFQAELSAGVDFSLLPKISLYAEPGISYSHSTGSCVHYYSENPFAFSLSAGIRFKL